MDEFENKDLTANEPGSEAAAEYSYGQTPEGYTGNPSAVGTQATENTVAGIVGALLFSIGGGLVAFLLSRVGFVAAISGLITMVLAVFGYNLFSGARKSGLTSKKAIIIGIIVTLIMLFVAEWCSWSYELHKAFLEEVGINVPFFDCVRTLSQVFKESTEDLSSFLLSLLMSYAFAAFGCFSYIRQGFKRK